ncbi:MAG: fibronectin type III domain-containing protein [Candidatus Hydrothermarchaeales archaeon]
MSDLKGFVFTGIAFLLVIPAMILAASFLNMMETGDEATALATKSDVVFAVYNNVDSSLELASCSYFLIYEDDTATILQNLTDYWAPYIEGNYTAGITVSIAEDEINVTYNSTEDYIKVGNINNIDEGIPVTITFQNIAYQRDLSPLRLYKNCSGEIVTVEEAIPRKKLYLSNISGQHNLTTESPTPTQNITVVIADGSYVEWVISPFDQVAFNTSGSFNVSDDIALFLYLKPIPDGARDPTASFELWYDGAQLDGTLSDKITTEDWWVDYFTGVTGTIIPANASLTLKISVDYEPAKNPELEVFFNSTVYDSGVEMPGYIISIGDTTPPVIANVSTTYIGPTSAIIEWDTDESSNSLVNYSTDPSLASPSTKSNATYTLSHVVNVTGLSPATTYYYEVLSTDPSSNTGRENNSGLYYNFTTLGTRETLWCNGSTPASDGYVGTCPGGALCDWDGTYIVINETDEVIVRFNVPTASVTEIYSAIIYWVDRGDGSRTLAAGDGTVWNWNSTTGAPPDKNNFNLQSLNITSYFLGVSVDDASDIIKLQVNYTNPEEPGTRTDDWEQVYVNVTYY